jgi:hypothetical protein
MQQPETIVFWGAGATKALGIRTTAEQTSFIKHATGVHSKRMPLGERVTEALKPNDAEPYRSALVDLIDILGDDDDNFYGSIDVVKPHQLAAMRRNWTRDAGEDELRSRIIELRLFYDWPALKALVSICPGSSGDAFKINDLFNLLDTHIPLGFGMRATVGASLSKESEHRFLDARRLIGAKKALLMLLIASFYIDYQACIFSNQHILAQYRDFALVLARRMQLQGQELACKHLLNQPSFYQGDVGFVSLNYDPILLWMQFIAHRELNQSGTVPHIGSPAVPLHLFHDFGHLIPARRISRGPANWPWYPMNEAAAQRLNEQAWSDSRVRLTKLLFPHGCLCWRECPDCRKLSSYHGDEWELAARGLFPPPPLRSFDTSEPVDWIEGVEREERQKGAIDARACLHCGTLTYAHHTQLVMQSSFKSSPPSFIDEIQRDLRATAMRAKHIIFMGYSLPPDDVAFRAFFSASRQREKGQESKVRCTIVGWDDKNQEWSGPAELESRGLLQERPGNAVPAAVHLFGGENVRYYGGGVPNVFLDRDRASEVKIESLLNWS